MIYDLRIKLNKICEYLLYLFVFLLPWQTRWIFHNPVTNGNVWEYGRMSLYAFDIIFFVLLISCVIRCLLNKFSIFPPAIGCASGEWRAGNFKFSNNFQFLKFKIQKAILFFLIIVFIVLNIVFSQDKILTFYWWLRIGEVLGFLWILGRAEFNKIKIAYAFLISMAISAGLGIYQFLTQSAFAFKWLGLAEHIAYQLGTSVVETADGRWLRAYGSLPHPNALAGFIVIALILLVWARKKIDPSPRLGGAQDDSKKIELLYCFITLLLVTGLFMTFSRASWIVFWLLIIGCIIHYIHNIHNKEFSIFPPAIGCVSGEWRADNFQFSNNFQFSIFKQKNINYLFLACVLIWVVFSVIYWPLVKTRLGIGEARLEIKSNQERIAGFSEAWQVFKTSPLIGVGMGNYTLASQKLSPGQLIFEYQPVHNIYILILAELGVLGFLGVLGWLGALGILGWLGREGRQEMVLISSLLFLFLFDHFWWTLASGLMVWALVIGLVGNKGIEE